MIKNIKSKKLIDLYSKNISKGIPSSHLKKISDILDLLSGIKSITDLNTSEFKSHKLAGKYRNYWSVRVKGDWRIIFKCANGECEELGYTSIK